MAINNFIPTIWSERLYQELGKKYIAASHCLRDYEGEIKEKGNKVKICGVDMIEVRDYTRNVNMSAPQVLGENARELVINQAKYFNFQVDDVDRMQAVPHLMDAAIQLAAKNLADVADQYIYSLYEDAGTYIETSNTDAAQLLSDILDARTILLRYNVGDPNDIIVEVTPDVAACLLRARIELQTENSDLYESGCIGRIYGMKVFVSNNIYREYNVPQTAGNPDSYHKCILRTNRAIAFAEQLSEIEAYRPELRFADAVKGLHLYGAKVLYPNEMALLNVAMYNEV